MKDVRIPLVNKSQLTKLFRNDFYTEKTERSDVMADFHQEGIITTLHALYGAFDRKAYQGHLEKKLEEYSRHLRIGLLLPSLYFEIRFKTKPLNPLHWLRRR